MAKYLEALDLSEDAELFCVPVEVEVRTKKGDGLLRFDTSRWEAADLEYRQTKPEPLPPFTRELIREPMLLQAMGERKPVVMREYDPRKPEYVLAREEWSDGRHLYVVAACLENPIKDKGQPVSLSTEEKGAKLRERFGLTTWAAAQIYGLIKQAGLVQEDAAAGNSVDDTEARPDAEG